MVEEDGYKMVLHENSWQPTRSTWLENFNESLPSIVIWLWIYNKRARFTCVSVMLEWSGNVGSRVIDSGIKSTVFRSMGDILIGSDLNTRLKWMIGNCVEKCEGVCRFERIMIVINLD